MKSYKFKINGNEYNVDINSVEGNMAAVTVNGTPYQVELENAPAAAPKPAASGAGKAVTSPLPGVIIAVKVNVGDSVKAGQEVAVLEAMKMENSIEATHDGTVTAIHVSKGDSVLEGAAVVTIG